MQLTVYVIAILIVFLTAGRLILFTDEWH